MSLHVAYCLEFLLNIQRERGLAALYLGSKGELAAAEMKQQFAATNSAVKNLQYLPRNSGSITSLSKALQALPAYREYIAGQFVRTGDVIDHYTNAFLLTGHDVIREILIQNAYYCPNRVSSFLFFLQWVNRLGLQRELGAHMAIPGWIDDFELIHRLQHLIREQQSYERMFFSIADDTQKKIFAAARGDAALMALCDDINGSITTGIRPVAALRSFAAYDWYTIFSAKINFLHGISIQLASHLTDDDSGEATTLMTNHPIDAEVEACFDRVKAHPLIRNIGPAVLRSILSQTRAAVYDKGSPFLVQGEQARRFYFILDGWVKLFKHTTEGEEVIVQILGKNEFILGTNFFEHGDCPFSARAITKTKVLSAPANVMRDHVLRHKDLALLALSGAVRHTQRLMAHFEQLTLWSATQRVGWYLLNLSLETGLDGRPINLPFDKSLIAACLNIKPETFSRILQSLRAKGLRIERQQVLLPEPFVLCDFCDSETAAKCDLAGTRACPKTEDRHAESA